jgi:hypothetical protein
VSTIASMFQTAAIAGLPFAQISRGLFSVATLGGFFIFFRPLLTGIARALFLVVRPRLTKEELAARVQRRDSRMMQRMISSANSPTDAAGMRALAARE